MKECEGHSRQRGSVHKAYKHDSVYPGTHLDSDWKGLGVGGGNPVTPDPSLLTLEQCG